MDKVGKKTLETMNKAKWYNRWLIKMVEKYLSGEILEIGAGIGNMATLLKQHGSLTVIDYNPAYVKKLKKEGFVAGFGDIEKGNYFFGTKKFDTIVCMNVLEHIKDDQRALKHMFNLLKAGGRIMLMVPAHMWAYGKTDEALGHYRRYETAGLIRLFKKTGFKILTARYSNWLSVIPWTINGRLFKRGLIPDGQLAVFDTIAPLLLYIENFISLPFGQSVVMIGEKR